MKVAELINFYQKREQVEQVKLLMYINTFTNEVNGLLLLSANNRLSWLIKHTM